MYTTPITSIGCRQCLPLSVIQLKAKHCCNGVVDTFGQCLLPSSLNFMVYFVLLPPFGLFRQTMFMKAGRREGGLLFRAIQFLEKFVNKLLLFNFIVECKGKKLRTHSAEPLVEGLTFFQLSCPLFAVAAVCNGQLSSTICGVSIKELQNWLIRN